MTHGLFGGLDIPGELWGRAVEPGIRPQGVWVYGGMGWGGLCGNEGGGQLAMERRSVVEALSLVS